MGVTRSKIRLYLSTTYEVENSGHAVKAVVDDVNRNGGICGRLLEVMAVNRGFDDEHRVRDVAAHAFAAMAEPLDEGLAARLRDGTIDAARMPVVGTDGLDPAQAASRWVWPLGPSTAALTRIAVDHAYRTAGARTFALVHDSTHPFGTDAAAALEQHVGRLPGAQVRHVQPLDPAKPSYGREVAAYNGACPERRCDVMLLALLPETEAKWRKGRPAPPRTRHDSLSPGHIRTGGLALPSGSGDGPPLWWWTGFTPPIGPFLDDPDVRRYADTVGHDSAFVMGAYVGAQALVAALRAVGPHLTRARLQDALDRLTLPSGIVGTVDWDGRERMGLRRARALAVTEDGRHDAGTGWVQDPG